MAKHKFNIGDRVRYATEFCRSIGAYTGSIPFARGEVVSFKECGQTIIAQIQWDNDDPCGCIFVNTANLEPTGKVNVLA